MKEKDTKENHCEDCRNFIVGEGPPSTDALEEVCKKGHSDCGYGNLACGKDFEPLEEKQKDKGNIMPTMPKAVIFEDGKPVASSDKEEAERLTGRIAIIDKVLKEMGFSEGYAKYKEYVEEMTSKDFKKYIEFTDRVDKLAKEQGV